MTLLLLSRSDANEDRQKALEFLFPQGQKVWVKVTAIESDERAGAGGGGENVRVNGSMKAVSQADGTDLDPAGRLMMGEPKPHSRCPLSPSSSTYNRLPFCPLFLSQHQGHSVMSRPRRGQFTGRPSSGLRRMAYSSNWRGSGSMGWCIAVRYRLLGPHWLINCHHHCLPDNLILTE